MAVAVAPPLPGDIEQLSKCQESLNGLVRYHRLFDQDFGYVLEPLESINLAKTLRQDVSFLGPKAVSTVVSFPVQFERPQPHSSGVSEIYCDATAYYIRLNVNHFEPEDLEVKVMDQERRILVHGYHARKDDEHGDIVREFTRLYVVPENVDLNKLSCEFRHMSTLFFEAPKLPLDGGETQERAIAINLEKRWSQQERQEQEQERQKQEQEQEQGQQEQEQQGQQEQEQQQESPRRPGRRVPSVQITLAESTTSDNSPVKINYSPPSESSSE